MSRRVGKQKVLRSTSSLALNLALATALREATPDDVDSVDCIAHATGLNRINAAALLAGELDLPVDVADEVLRTCTGTSLAELARTLRGQP